MTQLLRLRHFLSPLVLLALPATIFQGCGQAACEDTLSCPPGGGGEGAHGGNGGSGGGVPSDCVPSDASSVIADSCGLFISSSMGSDANSGSKDAPFKTINAALMGANGKPLYLCGEAFAEAVVLNDSSLFGALDCNDGWAYKPNNKSQIDAPADNIALRINGSASITVADLVVTAANAMLSGGSSIAALVDGATVNFSRCELLAGNGAAGAAGVRPSGTATAGITGTAGNDGCTSVPSVQPNSAVTTSCNDSSTSIGGLGGTGEAISSGGDGSNGDSTPAVTNAALNGGAGQTTTTSCGHGTVGADGETGAAGDGASGNGSIDTNGYTGVAGMDGQSNGKPGQGGGAGGGASGLMACDTTTFSGPSGGGGGSGGCGGQLATGGGAGGSSITLLSLSATIKLNASTLTASDGGIGGKGGDGQEGGIGGGGGNGGSGDKNFACFGNNGGKGGKGGDGGGGLGGHSIGIAYMGALPTFTEGDVSITIGATGAGGEGSIDNPGGAGQDGQASAQLAFSEN